MPQLWTGQTDPGSCHTASSRSNLQIKLFGPNPGHPDLAFFRVKIKRTQVTLIANVYNAPTGSIRANEGIQLLQKTFDTTQPALIIGDFNLRHEYWDARLQTAPRAEARQWQEWCNNLSIILLNKPGKPTL